MGYIILLNYTTLSTINLIFASAEFFGLLITFANGFDIDLRTDKRTS